MALDITAAFADDHGIELSFECDEQLTRFQVADVLVSEELSETYRASVELHTSESGVDASAMLGRNARLTIGRGLAERRLHGVVTQVEHGGVVSERSLTAMVVRVEIEPALCALKQSRDSRIFQELSVVEIVEELLAPLREGYQRSWQLDALKRQYPRREYTVQYQETDYEFMCRLLAEEGIAFYFKHEADELETLVFVDDNKDFPPFETVDGDPVPLSPNRTDIEASEPVFSFARADQATTTTAVVKDFDWTNPQLNVGKQEGEDGPRTRKLYDLSHLTIGSYQEGSKRYSENDAEARAKLLLERVTLPARTFVGEGLVTGFMPGSVFELVDHPLPGFDGKYLVTAVTHHAGVSGAGEEDSSDRYLNHFTALPIEVPYRPEQRWPQPRILGIQTATVVGPEGSEIYTDVHRRVKVQFHWDHQGRRDDRSSCYVRVAQTWAGNGFGFVFTPRIGMEVVVSFVDGNPDRPLIIGCVYNGDNPARYNSDAEQTRSLIRTKSFEGEGFNEIRFEDKKDNEEIFVHASKDYNEVVENDHSTDIKGKQSNTVAKSHTESVGGNQSLSVGGDRSHSVTGKEDITVEKDRTVTVTLSETRTIHQALTENYNNTRTTKVTGNDTETVNGNKAVTVQGGTTAFSSSGAFSITQDGSSVLSLDGAFDLSTPGKINASNDKTSFTGDGGVITLDANSEVKVVCGSATLTLKKDGTIAIDGKQLTLSGTTGIELAVGSNTIKVEPTGITVSGAKISSAAMGIHEINGATIKIG